MNRFISLNTDLTAYKEKEKVILSTAHALTDGKKKKMLKEARKKARFRVQRAHHKLSGTHPSMGKKWQHEGHMLAKKLIDPTIKLSELRSVISTMHTVLSAEKRFTIKSESKYCKVWGAYYSGKDRLIHTCPKFFKQSPEQQIRTMIHESAHAAGIVSKGPENYIIGYDCKSPSKPNFYMADYWAQYVHCLIGLPLNNMGSTITGKVKSKSMMDSLEEAYVEAHKAPSSSTKTTDWAAIKYKIVRILTEEEEDVWTTFTDKVTIKRKENEAKMLPVLEKYWRDGSGVSNWKKMAKKSAISGKKSMAWSAAFICWVMREAGVKREHGFRFGIRHMDYITEALRNREGENSFNTTKNTAFKKYVNKAFWLYDIAEQKTTPIEVGDILCMNRKTANGLTKHSYSSLKSRFFDGTNYTKTKTYGSSHCDLVVDKITKGGKHYLVATGGNKGIKGQGGRGWTVNSIEIEIDANGQILAPQKWNIFGFIKFRFN